VVSDAVVDLVALALEDVEARRVLVAVAVIGAPREELDEMHLQRLRQEGIVARAEHPRCPRLIGVAGVADTRVIDDGAGTADAVGGALAAAELAEPVGLGGEPAKEDPTLAFSHANLRKQRLSGERYNNQTIRAGGCFWPRATAPTSSSISSKASGSSTPRSIPVRPIAACTTRSSTTGATVQRS